MIRLPFAVVVLTLCLAGCGGDDDGPITPPAPIIPNYTGIWQGTYTVTSCTQNGEITLVNFCGETFATGRNLNFQLNLIQQGSTIIQGTFHLGTIAFTVVPAPLTSAGTVTVSGSTLFPGSTATLLTTWNLVTPITGTLSIVISAAGLTGQVNASANIGAVTKVGSLERQPASVPQALPDIQRGLSQ